MTNDLFPSDDRVPDLYIDRERPEPTGYGPGPIDRKPEDRKMIRGLSWLAWIVVIGLTCYLLFNNFIFQTQHKPKEMARGELLRPVTMGKFALGMRRLSKNPGGEPLADSAKELASGLNAGPIEQRFCHAVLQNEFESPEKADAVLKVLRSKTGKLDIKYSEKQTRIENILTSIFDSVARNTAPDVSADDQKFLRYELPWFGELALNTAESKSAERESFLKSAERSVLMMIGFMITLVVMLIAGAISFFVFATKILNGSLRHRVTDNSRYGPVYIETFAIWFVLFIGVSIALAATGTSELSLSTAALSMLLPLSALIWPVLRGVPNQDLLDDVGLRVQNPFAEIAAGFFAYLAMMPVLLIGLIGSVVVLIGMGMFQAPGGNEFTPTGVPHPIANKIFSGDAIPVMMTILLIASVLAPLTEEIMFRGVLYRHMRDGSRRMARWASIIFAALFGSLIFAAIHPQGLVGIPILTTLAFGFCLVRQWRGSLIAPMTMHAIHNTLATGVMVPLLV